MRRKTDFRYTELADLLRKKILTREIKPGQFLMSENELHNQYRVSRVTVRKSLELLLNEGLIVKKAGQGSMVPHDLTVEEGKQKLLRIVAISPSHFVDHCMPTIIRRFQDLHPEVEVKVLRFPHPEFWSSIRNNRELGFQPDIMLLTDRHFHMFLQTGDFTDLRPMLGSDLNTLYSRLTSAFRTREVVKALPAGFSPVYLAYNPLLFKKYGVPEPDGRWIKEDFIRTAQKLTIDTNGDGILDLYGFSLSSMLSRWSVIALQQGVNFHSLLHTEPMENTLTFIHDLLYRYRVAYRHSVSEFDLESHPFLHQRTAMMLTTSIELAGMRQARLPFEPGVAYLPFGDTRRTTLAANVFAVHSGCTQMEMAGQFLRTAIRPDVQEEIARQTGQLSVIPSINEKVWEKEYLDKLNIADGQIDGNFFVHDLVPHKQDLYNRLHTGMQLYWTGMESAKDFAKRLMNHTPR